MHCCVCLAVSTWWPHLLALFRVVISWSSSNEMCCVNSYLDYLALLLFCQISSDQFSSFFVRRCFSRVDEFAVLWELDSLTFHCSLQCSREFETARSASHFPPSCWINGTIYIVGLHKCVCVLGGTCPHNSYLFLVPSLLSLFKSQAWLVGWLGIRSYLKNMLVFLLWKSQVCVFVSNQCTSDVSGKVIWCFHAVGLNLKVWNVWCAFHIVCIFVLP